MRLIFWAGLIILVVLVPGCTRTRYRQTADRDAYSLVAQKAEAYPWAPPSDFLLYPDPTSRLYDPTPLDDPWLPVPAPQLYAYQIPALPQRSQQSPDTSEAVPPPVPVELEQQARVIRLPPIQALPKDNPVQLASHTDRVNHIKRKAAAQLAALRWVSPESTQALESTQELPDPPASRPQDSSETTRQATQESYAGEGLLNPIPKNAWTAIPTQCRTRMFEFDTLREEFRRTWSTDPPPDQLAKGQRLSLEDIIHLTLLNSREYQTQKENLYRVALRLSLERYAYQLKFSPFGNGTTVNWNHTRASGTTVNGLAVATQFQVEKTLATAGEFLARFANDVILTFNGPTGFAADVGSDLFLEFDQTIFQRDVRFESLTQSERDLVYAARDFARFRKLQFVQLASLYYNLIRTYRQVEIDSQNYFTLFRAFDQSKEEFGASFLPRFQLDQVEQNVLVGRSRLIATCNNLESAIDNLKLRIGLPTETPVNIDLTELQQLTTRDELSVIGELVRRARQRLLEERDRSDEKPSRVVLLSSSIVLIERMLESHRLQKTIGVPVAEQTDLTSLLKYLQVEAARENVVAKRADLQQELQTQPPDPTVVFLRSLDLIHALLELADFQTKLGEQRRIDNAVLEKFRQQHAVLQKRATELLDSSRNSNDLTELEKPMSELRMAVESVVLELDQLLGVPPARPMPEEQLRQSLVESDELLKRSDELLGNLGGGLTTIDIDMDDAMLTALNLRFDLMNERGNVADAWRQIKFAGDDLKAILNITATHRLSTRADVNRVFDFTFDESDTRVRASFDAPFNRRAQRNSYRQSLINYQVSLRQLMLLEDTIKFAVRNDLRGLALDKEQYAIEVASAALAYERVVSVRFELRLSLGRVAARDFLEAQNAYATALSNVAIRHIGYIIDRTQLFLDTELLTVSDDGFWHELYDEKYQPEPFYQLPPYATPVYGELVPGLWYSHDLRRMEEVPPGNAGIHTGAENTAAENTAAENTAAENTAAENTDGAEALPAAEAMPE